MKKWIFALILALTAGLLYTVNADYERLTENVVRLHVVANSDSEEDQALKLQARDAIQAYLAPILRGASSSEEARNRMTAHLEDIEAAARSVLPEDTTVTVTLQKEVFDTRHYDTFSLPAGVYDSLRVTIGEGAGHNWWCVVFPDFCYGDLTGEAESIGLSNSLTATLQGDAGYELRFGLLDLWGRFQTWLPG